jgi:sortase (surface protein transpeptidase)
VVPNDDWKIIRPQGYERLVLSACHPLYSSSHRWIVYAKGMSATLKGGAKVSLSS